MKKFFGIVNHYRFEWNDARAALQLFNLILILAFGLQMAWVGIVIAIFGIFKDLSQHRHINDLVLHTTTAILNIYLVTLA